LLLLPSPHSPLSPATHPPPSQSRQLLPLPCQPENKSHVPRHRLSLVHATKPGMEYGGWAGASTNEGANRRSRNHIEICPAATLSWIPKRRATADQIQEDMHFRPISVRAAVCLRREREREILQQ
jgi:hypothetical protein